MSQLQIGVKTLATNGRDVPIMLASRMVVAQTGVNLPHAQLFVNVHSDVYKVNGTKTTVPERPTRGATATVIHRGGVSKSDLYL